jgi:phosphoglycolate phosphatase
LRLCLHHKFFKYFSFSFSYKLRFQNIIFDLDGTLVDTAAVTIKCFERTASALGYTPPTLNRSVIGPPLKEIAPLLTRSSSAAQNQEFIETFIKIHDREIATQVALFKGVRQLLKTSSERGLRLFIATNKRQNPTLAILNHLQINQYFEEVFSVDSRRECYKSKSAMLADLVDVMEISCMETVYIGDRQEDKFAARENSINFIAADWGYGNWSDMSNGKKFDICKSPKAILQCLL